MHESYRADLWNVVSLVEGGCGDDWFDYFRYWLILQGKETFERVLARPETIADFDPRTSDLSNQDLGGVARAAYEKQTGQADMPYDGPTGPGEFKGELLNSEGLRRRYPDLWERFVKEEQQGGAGSLSAYFRRLFTEHPQLLDSPGLDEALACFIRDHPWELGSPTIKAVAMNVKSSLRSERARRSNG
jgi:hypothetical protein